MSIHGVDRGQAHFSAQRAPDVYHFPLHRPFAQSGPSRSYVKVEQNCGLQGCLLSVCRAIIAFVNCFFKTLCCCCCCEEEKHRSRDVPRNDKKSAMQIFIEQEANNTISQGTSNGSSPEVRLTNEEPGISLDLQPLNEGEDAILVRKENKAMIPMHTRDLCVLPPTTIFRSNQLEKILHRDILVNIFSHWDMKTIAVTFSVVCRGWYALTADVYIRQLQNKKYLTAFELAICHKKLGGELHGWGAVFKHCGQLEILSFAGGFSQMQNNAKIRGILMKLYQFHSESHHGAGFTTHLRYSYPNLLFNEEEQKIARAYQQARLEGNAEISKWANNQFLGAKAVVSAIESAVKHCQGFKILDFSGCSRFDVGNDLKLYIGDTDVSHDYGLDAVVHSPENLTRLLYRSLIDVPHLTHLKLAYCNLSSDRVFDFVKHLSCLISLDVEIKYPKGSNPFPMISICCPQLRRLKISSRELLPPGLTTAVSLSNSLKNTLFYEFLTHLSINLTAPSSVIDGTMRQDLPYRTVAKNMLLGKPPFFKNLVFFHHTIIQDFTDEELIEFKKWMPNVEISDLDVDFFLG